MRDTVWRGCVQRMVALVSISVVCRLIVEDTDNRTAKGSGRGECGHPHPVSK